MTISAGIDLGTTNSCLAYLDGEQPAVLLNLEGAPITPSVVSVRPDGVLVGREARSYLLSHPAQTFSSIKRKMGERYTRDVGGTAYTPESVSACILKHLIQYGEARLSASIKDVVITVPAAFNAVQRQATKDAGEIAGLNVLRVVNEPTAAALAYGHAHKLSSVLVVFDLGGGTFDISVVEAGGGMYEVVYSHGDNQLGGDDFNMKIVHWIVREFGKQSGHDIRRDADAMTLAREWAIEAKHALTDAPEAQLQIDDLFRGATFSGVLTRPMYEEMCRDLFDRVRSIAETVANELKKPKYREGYSGLFENGMAGCDILLVGGETRVPAVRKLVGQLFRGQLHTDVNPDEVVALGAAVQAGIIHRKGDLGEIVLVDTTALSLGTEVKGGLFSRIIEANTAIPTTKTSEYTPVADFQPAVKVGIYQGESEMVANNACLGDFEFLLQPPRPKQEATVQLTLHLDANDILHVSAVDKKTGNKQDLTIKGSQNLDRATIERLREQARRTQDADRARADELRRLHRHGAFAAEALERISQMSPGDRRNKFVDKAEDCARRLNTAVEQEDVAGADRLAKDLDAVWQRVLAAGGSTMPAAAAQPSPSRATLPGDVASVGVAKVRCPNCHAHVAAGLAFCGKCGVPLLKDNCGACGAALMEGFAFCGKCGAKA